MGLDATKFVFRVSDKAKFKPACSSTETNKKIGNLLVAIVDKILSSKRKTKAVIRLRTWVGWSMSLLLANPEYRHSCSKDRIMFYQLPLILTTFMNLDLINIVYLTADTFIRSK